MHARRARNVLPLRSHAEGVAGHTRLLRSHTPLPRFGGAGLLDPFGIQIYSLSTPQVGWLRMPLTCFAGTVPGRPVMALPVEFHAGISGMPKEIK